MDIEQKNRAYRRGLILGWTLAEIFLLILFILLLAFAASHLKDREYLLAAQKHVEKLVKQNDRLKLDTNRQTERIKELARANAELHEQNVYLKARLVLPNNFDDQFRELRNRQNQIDELQAKLAELNQRQFWTEGLEEAFQHQMKTHSDPRATIRQLMASADDADRALETMRSTGLAEPNDTNLRDPVERLANALAKAGVAGAHTKDIVNRLAGLTACRNELQQKQGQMLNLQRKLVALGGHGTEMPPCWVTPDGHIEYIFDVTLTSSGLIVHDNLLPDHIDEEKRFLSGMSFDKELTSEQFLGATNQIYEQGRTQKCGFFVRVFDGTRPNQKAVYKQRLQTVEAHFYKLLADRAGSTGTTDSDEEPR